MSDNKRSEIAKELGRAGGEKILRKYGTEHYKKMAEKRWKNKGKKEEKTDSS